MKTPNKKDLYNKTRLSASQSYNQPIKKRYRHNSKEVKAIAKYLKMTSILTDLNRHRKYSDGKKENFKIQNLFVTLLSLRKMNDYRKPS